MHPHEAWRRPATLTGSGANGADGSEGVSRAATGQTPFVGRSARPHRPEGLQERIETGRRLRARQCQLAWNASSASEVTDGGWWSSSSTRSVVCLDNEIARPLRLLFQNRFGESPLPDSNRRPPPYHSARRQTVATAGNALAECGVRQVRRLDRLPPFATAGLHKAPYSARYASGQLGSS
jgi:hypothetical protein